MMQLLHQLNSRNCLCVCERERKIMISITKLVKLHFKSSANFLVNSFEPRNEKSLFGVFVFIWISSFHAENKSIEEIQMQEFHSPLFEDTPQVGDYVPNQIILTCLYHLAQNCLFWKVFHFILIRYWIQQNVSQFNSQMSSVLLTQFCFFQHSTIRKS